ncbi:alpha/beta hydrolase family protein [Kribbella sp. NPDC051586]|uniref:alpha/beta hydrolase family protein n=1 Tax=Kribbella sp. NPDC051586 TaxID=3364118 RepID=UPI0037A00CEC
MITRRGVLVAGALAGIVGAADCGKDEVPNTPDPVGISYGEDGAQSAQLHLPAGGAKVPVAVVIHGGFWMKEYGLELALPLARDLAAAGIAGYAIEYRRVGNGGGWPTTFEDVAAAIDALAKQPRVDLGKVVAIGHSAGGQLAVWAAGRTHLPVTAPGSAPQVPIKAVVSQAGVLDLVDAYRERVGGDAVQAFLGATPDQDRERYALASPFERLPLKVPVALIHGTRDGEVPIEQSRRYRDAAANARDQVKLTELPNIGHFELIDPRSTAWATCRSEALRVIG